MEASNTPTIRRLTPSCRHQLPLIALFAASLGFLAFLGAIGARIGGANILRGIVRVIFWGALAMALTAGIGKLFGTIL